MFFPGTFVNGLVVAIREEFGWRGYMLPRLQSRWSALTSSLILGVFWAPTHLANWFMPPGDPIRTDSFWAFAMQIILTCIIYTWSFNNTGGNILAIVLVHTMSNSIGALIRIPGSFFTCLNWVLLLVLIPIVVIYGRKNLVRVRPEAGT